MDDRLKAKLQDGLQHWHKNSPLWLIFGLVIGFGLGVLAGNYGRFIWEYETFEAFVLTFWPEALGIVVTVGLLERIQANSNREQYKKQLIRQVSSRSNDIAIGAIEAIRDENWLVSKESVLQKRRIFNAQWQNAALQLANLEGSSLNGGNFSGAILTDISLSQSKLMHTIFKEANLWGANLEKSWLSGADMSDTNLSDANLEKAHMDKTILRRAILPQARFEGATIVESDLIGVIGTNCNFHSATIYNSNLENATLEESNLSKAILGCSKFINAKLQRSDLSDSFAGGCDFSAANLYKANLDGMNLYNTGTFFPLFARFSQETILPDGTYYIPKLGLEQMKRFGCTIESDQEPITKNE